MKRPHPFIGKTRDELDGQRWKKLGPAERLLDFLKSRQTSPDGKVYYHKELGYAWIRARIPNPPPERTLKRWMARLKELGEVEVRRMPYGGIRIRLLRSMKWAKQIGLFPEAGLPQPVETVRNSTISTVPNVAPEVVPLLAPEGSYRKEQIETNNPRASRAVPYEENRNAKDEAQRAWRRAQKEKRLLREVDSIWAAYAGTPDWETETIARRNYRLNQVYDELERIGWVRVEGGAIERTG